MTNKDMSALHSSTSQQDVEARDHADQGVSTSSKPVLHVISDRQRHQIPLLDALVGAAKGGADVIQIREKKAPASETFELVSQLHTAFTHFDGSNWRPSLFVNDRADIAIASDLSGVHLAAKSLPIGVVSALRHRSQWRGLIGCSVHALDEAKRAEEAGADYVTFGHIFASESHPNLQPRGIQALHRVVDALSIPVVAIGGIDKLNIVPVLETGCSGVAVIGAVLDAADPEAATRSLKLAMQDSSVKPKVAFWPIRFARDSLPSNHQAQLTPQRGWTP